MARGTWLSEEEKAEILQMRASGMTTAQIASQTQRGAKTIQRVVSGKFSSAPARGAPATTATVVDGEGGLPPTILQIPPLSRDHGCVEQAQTPQTTPNQKHPQQTVAASEVPREAIYTPQAGRTEAVRTSVNCEQRTAQNVKLPKRPKKLTRKPTTSTSEFSVNLKQPNQSQRAISTTGSLLGTAQSITIQRPQTSTTSVQPVAASAGCALNSPCPATGQDRSTRSIGGNRQQISVVPAEQATTTARGEQASREPLPFSDAATNPPRYQSQQPVRAESTSEVYRRSTTSGGPSVIPVNHLQQLLDETSEQHFVSMANFVSDDDSDDDIHVPSQPQTTATMFAHHQVEAQETPRHGDPVMAMERDRRRVQSVAQVDAGRFQTNAMESPLLSFEAQLRSSQGSSLATPVSQIEPEPIITKKRKLETSATEEAKSDPVERALAIFSEALTSTTKNPNLSFYEDRLALLFQRFQADVRLVQLERKEALTRFPNEALFSC